MASPFVPLLGKEYCTAIILGSSEEENNGKETTSSKNFESKFYSLWNFFSVNPSFSQEKDATAIDYVFRVLDYTIEILDPPPRRLI